MTFAIVISLLGMTNVSAQKKCKYNFDKEDPITEERVRRNTYQGYLSPMSIGLYRRADEFKLETNIRFNGIRRFSVTTSDQLVLKVGDESITLYPSREFEPIYSGNITAYAISYDVDREVFQKISDSGIKIARNNVGGETWDFKVKDKMLEKIKIGANCMLQD